MAERVSKVDLKKEILGLLPSEGTLSLSRLQRQLKNKGVRYSDSEFVGTIMDALMEGAITYGLAVFIKPEEGSPNGIVITSIARP
jgi:hypothetical protein